MTITINIGDLFSIPIDATRYGIGLVAGKWKSELYLVLFKEQFDGVADINAMEVEKFTPILASSSLDAKLWHGHWPIIRHGVDTVNIAQPIYKIEEPGGIIAESFDRKYRQPIDSYVAKNLNYRKVIAPVRLENALKAYHGLRDWEAIYEGLVYQNIVQSRDAFLANSKVS